MKIAALYSKFEAFQLFWNRFYNKYGLLGGNISLDLKKEQLHKVLKTIWRALGPNLNKTSASQVAEALANLERLLNSIDKDCTLQGRRRCRSKGDNSDAVMQVMADLIEIKAFRHTPGRDGHQSFPKFPSSTVNLVSIRL